MTVAFELCKQIRNKLRSKNITQEEFAKLLNISTPTVKRWLRGDGLLIADLIRMLELLGLSLSEISLMADGTKRNNFTYTQSQEELFSEYNGTLAFFDLLLKGKSPLQIRRQHKLNEKSVSYYLSKLDRVKLIEWLPNNKARLLVSGEPTWLKNGPLSKKFRKQIINAHLLNYSDNREHLKIGIYSLSSDSLLKLQSLILEITEKVRTLEIIDHQNAEIKKLTTLMIGFGQNEIPILSNIPNQ